VRRLPLKLHSLVIICFVRTATAEQGVKIDRQRTTAAAAAVTPEKYPIVTHSDYCKTGKKWKD